MRDHVESIKKGQFIVITRDRKAEEHIPYEGYITYTGQPYEVLSIDFPFIAVKVLSENRITALDCTQFDFKVTTRRYAQQFMGGIYHKCPLCNHNLLVLKSPPLTLYKCMSCSFNGQSK